ncbi:unnamed protein product, partial [Rotaria sp. Silwood2]
KSDPLGVTAIGSRVSGVGVAGLTLGGGYSWKSNQYGLTIDNVVEYEGGLNNFGIVTKFTMRAVPQTEVYGGLLFYDPLVINAVIQALVNFQANNKDPKAQITGSFIILPSQYFVTLLVFYDAPTAPAGIFDEFIKISSFGTLNTQSYLTFVQAAPVTQAVNLQSRYSTVSITQLSTNLLRTINNQLLFYNSTLGSKPGAFFIYSIEPFISTYFDKSQGGAYPHVPSSTPLFPLLIQFGWESSSDNNAFIDGLKSTTNTILQAALDDGQDIGGSKQIRYPNNALGDTPLEQMYGDNVAKLRSIRQAWDPYNIMYLCGGFKF